MVSGPIAAQIGGDRLTADRRIAKGFFTSKYLKLLTPSMMLDEEEGWAVEAGEKVWLVPSRPGRASLRAFAGMRPPTRPVG
jgi:hypothetical protein